MDDNFGFCVTSSGLCLEKNGRFRALDCYAMVRIRSRSRKQCILGMILTNPTLMVARMISAVRVNSPIYDF